MRNVYIYLTESLRSLKNEKRVIRRTSKKFSVRDGEMFYRNVKRGRGSSKVYVSCRHA